MITESISPLSDIMQDGITVVYVTAKWCGPCKIFGPQVEKLSEQHSFVKFVKVDADDAAEGLEALTKSLGTSLRSVPTTLVFEDGALINTIIGNQAANLSKILKDSSF